MIWNWDLPKPCAMCGGEKIGNHQSYCNECRSAYQRESREIRGMRNLTATMSDSRYEWMDKGKCKGKLNLMFPHGDDGQRSIADAICNGCPVIDECLEYALVNRIDYGVWGGATEKDRRKRLRRAARGQGVFRDKVNG